VKKVNSQKRHNSQSYGIIPELRISDAQTIVYYYGSMYHGLLYLAEHENHTLLVRCYSETVEDKFREEVQHHCRSDYRGSPTSS